MKTVFCLIFFFTSISIFGQKSEMVNSEWIGGFCTHLKFEEDSCQVFSNGEKYAYTATDSILFFSKRSQCVGLYYEIRNDSLQFSRWDYWKLPDRSPCGFYLYFSPRLLKRRTKDFKPLTPFDSLVIYAGRHLSFSLNNQREFTFKLGFPSTREPGYNLPGYYSGKLNEEEWNDLIEVLDNNCTSYITPNEKRHYDSFTTSIKIWYDSLKRQTGFGKANEFTRYIYENIPSYTFHPSDETGRRDTVPRTFVDLNGYDESIYVEGKIRKSFFNPESQKYFYSFKTSEKFSNRGPLILLYSYNSIPSDSLVGIKRAQEKEPNFEKTKKRGFHIRYYKVDSVYKVQNHNVSFSQKAVTLAGSHQKLFRPPYYPRKKLFADWKWRMSDLAKFLKEIAKDSIRMREEND